MARSPLQTDTPDSANSAYWLELVPATARTPTNATRIGIRTQHHRSIWKNRHKCGTRGLPTPQFQSSSKEQRTAPRGSITRRSSHSENRVVHATFTIREPRDRHAIARKTRIGVYAAGPVQEAAQYRLMPTLSSVKQRRFVETPPCVRVGAEVEQVLHASHVAGTSRHPGCFPAYQSIPLLRASVACKSAPASHRSLAQVTSPPLKCQMKACSLHQCDGVWMTPLKRRSASARLTAVCHRVDQRISVVSRSTTETAIAPAHHHAR